MGMMQSIIYAATYRVIKVFAFLRCILFGHIEQVHGSARMDCWSLWHIHDSRSPGRDAEMRG